MHPFLWLVVFVGLVAGAAWATRPGVGDFDALLRAEIERNIAKKDVGGSDDPIATIALVGCKLRPTDCFDVIRSGLDVRVDDRTFYTRFEIKGFGREAICTGAFTKFWCDKELFAD